MKVKHARVRQPGTVGSPATQLCPIWYTRCRTTVKTNRVPWTDVSSSHVLESACCFFPQ